MVSRRYVSQWNNNLNLVPDSGQQVANLVPDSRQYGVNFVPDSGQQEDYSVNGLLLLLKYILEIKAIQ